MDVSGAQLSSAGLSAADRARIAERADRSVMQRSRPAYFIYFALCLLFSLGSPYAMDHPEVAASFVLVELVLGGVRVAFHTHGSTLYRRHPRRWRLAFASLALGSTVTFSAFVCSALVWYGAGTTSFLLVLCSAGVSAGATNTLSPNLRLLRVMLVSSLTPVIVTSLIVGGQFGFGLAAIVALQLAFHFVEGKRVHDEYWQALTNNVLLEVRQKSNALLAMAVEHADEAIEITDAEGCIEHVNPAFARITGFGLSEAVGRPAEFVGDSPQPADMGDCEPWRTILAGGVWRGSLRRLHKDGSTRYQEATVSAVRNEAHVITHYVAVTRDMTARRLAEEALARSQRDFRQVIEKNPDGVAILRDGVLIYANAAWAEALGYGSPDQLVGKRLAQIVHADECSALGIGGHRDGEAMPPIPTGEIRFLKSDGGVVMLEVAPNHSIEFEGARATLVTARDVTERRKLQTRLMLADRMASIGTLAAGVAHEINNPLAAAMLNLDYVGLRLAKIEEESRTLGPEIGGFRTALSRIETAIAEAREQGNRVAQIVRDLKAFSRTDEERRGPVDVRQVMESSLRMAWNEIRHRARLVKDYGDTPPVLANDARLGQVFLNLVVNAAQSIPEGDADRNEIRISTGIDASGRVAVCVGDTGAGIPAEIQERIFDPFFTTKPIGVGTGLGLSISHRIITTLGGEITVHSQPGSGTELRVLLPAAAEPPAVEQRSDVATDAPVRRARILVVDDEPTFASAVHRLLGQEHEVTTMNSPRDALDRLAGGDRFDVILCDLMMPQMTGMDLHAELVRTAADQAARMIFVTGGAFTPRARSFLAETPNPHLDKPLDAVHLRALISRRIRASEESL